MSSRALSLSLWGAATLMVAGVVHLASILILPEITSDNAYLRLVKGVAPNTVSVLPRPGSVSELLPFRDPALGTAICRYDLHDGDLRIGAPIGDTAFLAISFHTSKGVPFYALTSRSGNEGRIDLVLLTPAQLEKLEAADSGDGLVREVRVTAPAPQGFVQFDVLPRVGGYPAAMHALSSASCKLEAMP